MIPMHPRGWNLKHQRHVAEHVRPQVESQSKPAQWQVFNVDIQNSRKFVKLDKVTVFHLFMEGKIIGGVLSTMGRWKELLKKCGGRGYLQKWKIRRPNWLNRAHMVSHYEVHC